jgi:signal transduction histidine kinase/CheY-like chemotaxis protein
MRATPPAYSPARDVEFRRLLEKLPAAAYTCDASGLITFFNRHAVDLWGRTPKVNDPVDRFCGSFRLFGADGSPICHDRCWMALALTDGKEYNGLEIIVERPDGSRRTVLAHANPYQDEQGRTVGAVNVLVDITDRKKAEDALREADRRKDEFLATLAHELRNPLAPLRNALQIMRLAGGNGTAADQARTMMERQLQQMVRLIDDLLDVNRISRGKLQLRRERVELAAVLADAVETARPLIDAAGHELAVAVPPQPLYLEADPIRLAQVFANLLNNAAKYTDRGGHLRLTAERQGSDVAVTVADDGIGIPADALPHIFEMFAQVEGSLERSHGGLGIGLTLVRRMVELHGGTVEAVSDGPGRGSAFTVRLPLVFVPPAEEPIGPSADSLAEPVRCRILAADDNKDAAASLGTLLRMAGHEVRVVHDGLVAVEEAASFRPDVVLLDIGMPKLNGYEAAGRIRQQPWGQGMVLIALTGWGQDEDRIRSQASGFDHHLVKPVDPAALERLLTAALAPA